MKKALTIALLILGLASLTGCGSITVSRNSSFKDNRLIAESIPTHPSIVLDNDGRGVFSEIDGVCGHIMGRYTEDNEHLIFTTDDGQYKLYFKKSGSGLTLDTGLSSEGVSRLNIHNGTVFK